MDYKPTIGLEIHVELKTKTKMFCNCLNDPEEKHPNINVCPICMGHPGTLPVINKEAIKKVLTVGRALKGNIPEYSQFDRKNYFYPDLPKGYQISQYKYPLVDGGELNGVKIRRIHLEEDTGSLSHGSGGSLVNFNRAGVPLMELVTEPVIVSDKEARKFAEELQLIFRYLGISKAEMEKGQMRVEVNISLSKAGLKPTKDSVGSPEHFAKQNVLGTKVEIKNLNSFRAVEKAIDFEIKRQKEILNKGEKVVQETRGWDENKELTFSQREKEESHDYRYFPEPDLPAINLTKLDLGGPAQMELPQEKRKRFKEQFNLIDEQIEILIQDKNFADYFEKVVSELENNKLIQLAVNYLLTDFQSLIKEKMLSYEEVLVTPENFAELINLIGKNRITSRVGKDVLRIMIEKGGDPSLIVEEKGLGQISDESAINDLVKQIIEENPLVIEDYKKGKKTAIQFLVGQGMKKTKGSVNPKILKRILKEKVK
jgi:aspartyl-tRNA(Asn)/glutamyl-tRNA(Gln) amidotransferase subunit B